MSDDMISMVGVSRSQDAILMDSRVIIRMGMGFFIGTNLQ